MDGVEGEVEWLLYVGLSCAALDSPQRKARQVSYPDVEMEV